MGVAKKTRKFAQMKRVIGEFHRHAFIFLINLLTSPQALAMPACMSSPPRRVVQARAPTDTLSSKKNQLSGEIEAKKKAEAEKAKREIPQAPSSMFFMANEALGPPCVPPSTHFTFFFSTDSVPATAS
jgi:hypothetical protein